MKTNTRFALRILKTNDATLASHVGALYTEDGRVRDFTTVRRATEFLETHLLTSDVEIVTYHPARLPESK